MKKWLTYVCLGVILFTCVFTTRTLASLDRSYEGHDAPVPVYELQQNPDAYDVSIATGAADAIVQENLAETHAVNDVTSIVFDFRGYDTLGESFILLTAIAGSFVILSRSHAKKKEGKEDAAE